MSDAPDIMERLIAISGLHLGGNAPLTNAARDLRAAIVATIAADDDFRQSMAPGVQKDPLTDACERLRAALGPPHDC